MRSPQPPAIKGQGELDFKWVPTAQMGCGAKVKDNSRLLTKQRYAI